MTLTAILIYAGIFSFSSLFSALYYRRLRLNEFRNALRIGDTCRVKFPGICAFNARIIKKENLSCFVAEDLDTKKTYLTPLTCIYL